MYNVLFRVGLPVYTVLFLQGSLITLLGMFLQTQYFYVHRQISSPIPNCGDPKFHAGLPIYTVLLFLSLPDNISMYVPSDAELLQVPLSLLTTAQPCTSHISRWVSYVHCSFVLFLA